MVTPFPTICFQKGCLGRLSKKTPSRVHFLTTSSQKRLKMSPQRRGEKVPSAALFLTLSPFGPQGPPREPPGDSQDQLFMIWGRFGLHFGVFFMILGRLFTKFSDFLGRVHGAQRTLVTAKQKKRDSGPLYSYLLKHDFVGRVPRAQRKLGTAKTKIGIVAPCILTSSQQPLKMSPQRRGRKSQVPAFFSLCPLLGPRVPPGSPQVTPRTNFS